VVGRDAKGGARFQAGRNCEAAGVLKNGTKSCLLRTSPK
jgi:hypothetical protein